MQFVGKKKRKNESNSKGVKSRFEKKKEAAQAEARREFIYGGDSNSNPFRKRTRTRFAHKMQINIRSKTQICFLLTPDLNPSYSIEYT